MGCCNVKYNEVVDEEEKRINEKGSDVLPASLKWISGGIVVLAIGAILLFY